MRDTEPVNHLGARAAGWVFIAVVAMNAATGVCGGWGGADAPMPCCVTLTGDIQGPTLQPCCLAEGQQPQSEPAGTPVTGAAPPAPPDLAWTDARLVTPNARADWHPDT